MKIELREQCPFSQIKKDSKQRSFKDLMAKNGFFFKEEMGGGGAYSSFSFDFWS